MFGERLRKAADFIGGQAELSRKTGISSRSISDYVQGKADPSRERLVSIAMATGVNIEWLAAGVGTIAWGSDGSHSEGPGDFDFIPMAEAQLSAGDGAFVVADGVRDYYAFRKEWVSRTVGSRENAILVQVIGNSMAPTILENDVVMLDRSQLNIYEGKIYALRMDSTIMVKRLALRPWDKVLIISDNRAEYEPYEADRKDVHVLGQVVWFARTLGRSD